MNQGQPLNQIREELGRNAATKIDYVVPARTIHAVPIHNYIIGIEGLHPDKALPLDNHANIQLANYVGIPKPYYEKLLKNSASLLSANINYWLNKMDSHRLIRTINGVIVAILTDKYKILDNDRLLDAILPILEERRCEVLSSCLTGTKLYIKAATPNISRIIQSSNTPDDVVQAGIMVTNSEVGHGKLSILPFTYRTCCKNGIIKDIVSNGAIRRQHLGRGFEIGEEVYSIEPELMESSKDRKFWDRVQSTIAKALSDEMFDRVVNNIEFAARIQIKTQDAERVANRIRMKYDIPQPASDYILKYIMKEGDFSKWGLVNAVTQSANDFTDYETSTFLEKVGGDILTCTSDEWRRLGGQVLPQR